MRRFVLYRRVSTTRQGKSGLGLDVQTRDIDLFLENYVTEPYEVIGDFLEVHTGADNSRPQLMMALDVCRQVGAELLVSRLDRLSRRVSFIAGIMDDPRVILRVASMPNADNFQLHIFAALAEQEREFISLRTKAALAPLKGTGKLGGLRDQTVNRNIATQRNAALFAQQLASIVIPLRTSGQSLSSIANALNAAGVLTSRQSKWTPMQVKRVLDRLSG